MSDAGAWEVCSELLRSAHIFAAAVREEFEAAILRDLTGDNLTFSQLKLLHLVAQADGRTIGDAAEFLGVSDAAASKTVEKLVRRRLLQRTEIRADRRSSHLSLTEAGRRLLDEFAAARRRKAIQVFSQLSVEDLQESAGIMDRLSGLIVSYSTAPEGICVLCQAYCHGDCKFGELSRSRCFYKRHKGEKPGSAASPADDPDKGEVA
jgi:DNA-binding MarR family transcriptional regulator